jgi:AcrR family transcriptional regulator
MKNKPDTPRRYNSQSRRARAAETKQRILDVARALFGERGLDAVTIDELSAAAGVSSPTVYALFGSKVGILKALIDSAFFGESYAALADRTKGTNDPIELLRITASISRTIFDRERREIGLIRGSSALSPVLKSVETEFERMRFDLQEARARLLVKTFPSARALGLTRVREIMWMFTGRDIYRMFVLERGWTSDAYERWLANTLIQALTRTPAAD